MIFIKKKGGKIRLYFWWHIDSHNFNLCLILKKRNRDKIMMAFLRRYLFDLDNLSFLFVNYEC